MGLWFDDAFGVRLTFGDRNMTFHIWESGVTLTLSLGGVGGNVGSRSANLFTPSFKYIKDDIVKRARKCATP